MDKYKWKKVSNDTVSTLKMEWLNTLTSPQDGMWEAFRDGALVLQLMSDDQSAGYACLNEGNELIQFYLSKEVRRDSASIFSTLLHEFDIKSSIVGTNNPIFLSAAMEIAASSSVHTYLFREFVDIPKPAKEGDLQVCAKSDLEEVVGFCEYSTGAPKEWLMQYIGDLIEKGEVFALRQNDSIIGTCEVRKSETAPSYADIGMIVSPDFRKQGYGSYLLNSAKSIAIDWNKTPICSCEKDNVGSVRSIQNCGFISDYQLLSVKF